jgi:hypothetical protein
MGVQAKQSSEIVHAANFVDSQFDTSKAAEFSGMLYNISTMMDILSQQQSGAFRVVAKPRTPAAVLRKSRIKKKNVSTLALLFGKNNSSKRHRPTAGADKQKSSSLAQHGKTKRLKTTVKHKVKYQLNV